MEYSSGTFICPKCGNNKITKYKIWESKSIYQGDKLIKTYILYESVSYFICCSTFREGPWDWDKICNEKIGFIIVLCLCLFILSIVYVLIFFWIDLIHYFCCKTKKNYSQVIGGSKDSKVVHKEKGIYVDNIWNELDGLSEEQLNYEEVGICSNPNCRYTPPTFLEFIHSPINLDETNQQINIEQNGKDFLDMNELILFNFVSNDGTINYNVCCKKSDLLIDAEKKLLNEYPELLNKKYNYILNGNSLLDKRKSIEEIGIKNRDNVLINEI